MRQFDTSQDYTAQSKTRVGRVRLVHPQVQRLCKMKMTFPGVNVLSCLISVTGHAERSEPWTPDRERERGRGGERERAMTGRGMRAQVAGQDL